MFKLFKNSYLICKNWVVFLLGFLVYSNASAQYKFSNQLQSNSNSSTYTSFFKDKTSLKTKIESLGKSNIFTRKSKRIGYNLNLNNNLKQEQIGSITTKVANAYGQVLYSQTQPFSIRKRGEYNKEFVFDAAQLQPGMYVSNVSIITDVYADSLSYSFGYDVESVTNQTQTPNDFIQFWQQAQSQLNATPANYNIVARSDIKNSNCDVYEVQFNGIDKALLFGWLTIPRGGRNLPVIYQISDYMGELSPEFRRDIAVFSLMTRGSGASNSNYNFDYNTLGLHNINDKNKYILKGMFLDALRGFEFLNNNKFNLKTNSIIVVGNGLGATIGAYLAAVQPTIKALIMDSPSFLDYSNTFNFNDGLSQKAFPSSMFSNYYNSRGVNKNNVLNTLSYFDAVNFAPYIACPTLVGFGLQNNGTPASSVYSFYNQLRVNKKEKYTCKSCSNSLDKGFYGYKEAWIKNIFRLP